MKPRMLLTVIAAAALAIAGAAVIILTANQPPRPPRNEYYGSYPTAPPEEPGCQNMMTIYFKTDEAMLQAAPRLERDSRFYNTVRETKAQNYERFKRIFAGQPELVAQARLEAIPASVTFSVDSSISKREVLPELRSTYAPAEVPDPCELHSQLPGIPTTTTTR